MARHLPCPCDGDWNECPYCADDLAELIERGEQGEDDYATGPEAPATWLNRPQPVAERTTP